MGQKYLTSATDLLYIENIIISDVVKLKLYNKPKTIQNL